MSVNPLLKIYRDWLKKLTVEQKNYIEKNPQWGNQQFQEYLEKERQKIFNI